MLTQLCDGVWCDTGPVSILGMRLTATMTVLRLGDGSLLVHSPLPLTAERRDAVLALGAVTHLYAPNTYHHAWIADWCAAFPDARVHAPRELASKRPDLRIDRFHDELTEPAFAGVVDEVPVRGFRLRETVLVHRPTRTAIVTDLVQNIGRPAQRWAEIYTRLMGFYDRVALSRVLRWAAFDDRSAARQSVDELLTHEFETLVVGHGAPITSGGRAALVEAMRWLPVARVPKQLRAPARPARLSTRPCG